VQFGPGWPSFTVPRTLLLQLQAAGARVLARRSHTSGLACMPMRPRPAPGVARARRGTPASLWHGEPGRPGTGRLSLLMAACFEGRRMMARIQVDPQVGWCYLRPLRLESAANDATTVVEDSVLSLILPKNFGVRYSSGCSNRCVGIAGEGRQHRRVSRCCLLQSSCTPTGSAH